MRAARPRTSDGWRASGRSARCGPCAISPMRGTDADGHALTLRARCSTSPSTASKGRSRSPARRATRPTCALPGMLYLAYARSPLPHARIVSIDTSAAKAVPGVHAVLTGADIGFVGLGRQTAGLAGAGGRPRPDDRRSRGRRRRREQGRRRRGRAVGRGRVRGAAARHHRERARSGRAGPPSRCREPTRSWGRSGRRPPTPTSTATSLIQKSRDRREHRGRLRPRGPRVRAHVHDGPRVPGISSSRARACVWIDEDDRVHIINTNKAPAQFRQQLAASAGHRGGPDRRGLHVHRRRFRRQGTLDRRVRLLLPGASDRPTDQGGDELPGRDAGEQLAPSRGDHQAADRRRP